MLVAMVGGLQSPEMLWGRRGGNGAGHLLSDTERMKMGEKKEREKIRRKKRDGMKMGNKRDKGGRKWAKNKEREGGIKI